jgi:cellulose biosynthesis protein BcsQ
VEKKPYILVLGSHKGGTGRTTAALALAHLWGQAGLSVSLIDADPVGAARLVALDAEGCCNWERVRFFPRLPDSGRALVGSDVVVIDAPALTERSAQRVLRLADGVIVTCLADPLSLRTIPTAATAINQARGHNARLSLLGLLIAVYHEKDPLQAQLLQHLLRTQGRLVLEPTIPYQQEVCDWALQPGSPLPEGPARDGYLALASRLEPILFPLAALPGPS